MSLHEAPDSILSRPLPKVAARHMGRADEESAPLSNHGHDVDSCLCAQFEAENRHHEIQTAKVLEGYYHDDLVGGDAHDHQLPLDLEPEHAEELHD